MSTVFEASWDQLKAAEAEIERLRAALRQIIAEADSDDGMTAWDGSEIAREALGPRPDGTEVERLKKGIQDYLNGDYEPRIKKMERCSHGRYGYETCESCIDEHFQRLLTDR